SRSCTMSSLTPSSNGHLPSATDCVDELVYRILTGNSGDASLFSLFARLAREAGREDLHAEFIRRAAGASPAASEPPATPATLGRVRHPEATQHHDEGCRLVREGQFADAEVAFREAIRLDPAHPDAHGNLGVA